MTTINAIVPWFGSKRTLAPRIVEAIGKHTAYWEPFCGSIAVLLAKPQATMETVNDLHGDLINLARVLADEKASAALYQVLSKTLFHESLVLDAVDRIKQDRFDTCHFSFERARDFLITSWCGRNGVSGTASYNHAFCVRYTKNGGHAGKRWLSAVESIPEWHQRLRSVTILKRDAFDILDRIEDAEGVAIYCDPPYVTKGAKYVHDFASDDHERLAMALRRFKKTRVVVSYYDHSRVQELYDGWRIKPIDVTKAMAQQSKRDQSGATKATELIISNEPKGLF